VGIPTLFFSFPVLLRLFASPLGPHRNSAKEWKSGKNGGHLTVLLRSSLSAYSASSHLRRKCWAAPGRSFAGLAVCEKHNSTHGASDASGVYSRSAPGSGAFRT
jgi:hypothetical protein